VPQLAVDAEGISYRYNARRSVRWPTAVASRGGAPRHAPGIDELSLGVHPGQIIGLLGPNGGGKSTLLRLLATALRPVTGTLMLLGRRAFPPDQTLRRAIGYAADTPVHLEVLSGRANALAFARAAGMPNAAAIGAVDELFERLSLAPDAQRAVREYSHGMRRKVLVTEALAHRPQLILLDEPTLGLDPPAVNELSALLRERAAAGAAVILATHELDLASRLCHRVIFMLDGRSTLDGTPDALLRTIDPGTRIRIALRAPLADPLHLDGVETVQAGAHVIELRTAAGAAVLPALCAALVRENVQLHTIELREPDLRDVFMSVTGTLWSEAS
jgi:ABC-2 type transport system ATP-binding protein